MESNLYDETNFDSFSFNREVLGPCESAVNGLKTLWGSILSLQASVVSVHGPPRLYLNSQKLLNFDFNVDPDPAFPLMWIWILLKQNGDPRASGSATLFSDRSWLCQTHKATTLFYQYASSWSKLLEVQQLVIWCLARRIPHVSNSLSIENQLEATKYASLAIFSENN